MVYFIIGTIVGIMCGTICTALNVAGKKGRKPLVIKTEVNE